MTERGASDQTIGVGSGRKGKKKHEELYQSDTSEQVENTKARMKNNP